MVVAQLSEVGGIPTDTGDRARGELIAYLALRFTAEDFPRLSWIFELDLLTFIERAQSSALDGGDVHENYEGI